jgi:hypothetical protein
MAKKRSTITSAYDAARSRMQTGDVVLFSGKGGLSQAIKWFTDSGWSHVGMVFRLELDPPNDLVMLWESTSLSDLADYESGRPTKGVQLVVLSERVKRYKGGIAIRHLSVTRTPAMKAALAELRQEFRGRAYERGEMELIKAAYDGEFGENREDLSSLFCSELVAAAYGSMGLLPAKPAANEYTPRDFSAKAKRALPLSGGARLGPEVWLKR